MPRKCDEETRAKAVRLVVEHAGDYASENEALKTVAGRLGMHPESLRKWIRQAEIDAGDSHGVSAAALRIRELKRKNCRAGTHHRDPEVSDEFFRPSCRLCGSCRGPAGEVGVVAAESEESEGDERLGDLNP